MIQSAVAMCARKTFSVSADAMQVEDKENTPQTDAVMENTDLSVQKDKERGRRMMGVLLGTLNRFKAEESENAEATLRKTLLEQKLAQKLQREKELLAEAMARKEEQKEAARAEALKERESQISEHVQELLVNVSECHAKFRKTQTEPALFWMPNI